MTTLAQAVQSIQAAFLTAWAAITPAVPVVFDGEARSTPTDGSAYARLTIRHVPDQQTSLGRAPVRMFTHAGVVLVEIFAPGGDDGRKDIDAMARVARGAFHGKTLAQNVYFQSASIQEQSAAGRWLQWNVAAPFTYLEME